LFFSAWQFFFLVTIAGSLDDRGTINRGAGFTELGAQIGKNPAFNYIQLLDGKV